MQVDLTSLDGLYQSANSNGCGPYEPSIASSAPSSQPSVFSDPSSVQSSIASSISDDFRLNPEDAKDRAYAQAQIQQKAALDKCQAQTSSCNFDNFANFIQGDRAPPHPQPSYADVTSVPKQQRSHPRRTSLSRHQKPPALQRQCDRKVNFVESLVDSATQMVEVIWPLSYVPCRSESGGEKSVLPLRLYIEETLRRSKTSYSTLQVALYYLVLIKPHVPKRDFTQEQRMDCAASRALMCGRRMFLAALILASKYLQDRNYSTKAWSKMSGLKMCEINFNERTFLSKICWKLHIPEPLYKKWTEVVLEFTPHQPPPSPGQSMSLLPPSWKAIIPLLTPEMDRVPTTGSRQQRSTHCNGTFGHSGLSTPTTPTSSRPSWNLMQLDSLSQQSTPTPATVLPRFLEPSTEMEPPMLPRMGPLPTPQMTPSSVASSTPAVGACGSRRPSMSSAMAMAQTSGLNRCLTDIHPCREINAFSRRPSATSASTRSSPESMVSHRSRSSRASSISSISTVSTNSSLAPNRACLARQATCRNVRLPMPPATVVEEREGSATKPIVINDSEIVEIESSPDMVDFSISDKVLCRPDKHSKHGSSQTTPVAAAAAKTRKRCRASRGNRRSHLQEELRHMVEEAEDLMDIDDECDDQDYVSPSPAAEYATKMLSRSNSVVHTREVQPPAQLSRSGSGRMPVQRSESAKRTCLSTAAGSRGFNVAPLYGEVA